MTDAPPPQASWPQEVEEFYSGLSLDDGPLESIVQLQNAGLQVRLWRRVAAGLAVACAVVMIAGAIVVSHAGKGNAPVDHGIADKQPSATDNDTRHGSHDNGDSSPSLTDSQRRPAYDLIAVRLHRDWCPKCKQMGNVFVEIQHDLDGRRILFVTYNLTDEVTTRQSLLLGEILQIKAPLEKLGSGNIALLTPGGELLELLDGTSGRQFLADQIAMRL